jgi:2-keto-4-pentenoate hydratase
VTRDQLHRAADALWHHWQQGTSIPALPEATRPSTRAEGYAIQATLETRTSSPIFGWKIAATSKAGQAHIAVDGPLAGRLLRERAGASGDEMPYGCHPQMRCAEAEFAFRMGTPLPPRETPYTVDQVLAAVATLHPAIELPDSRYDDVTTVGAAQLIADNACAHYFALGAAAPSAWRDLDLVQHRVLGTVAGTVAGKLEREGIGANVLGDPRVALAWLANELSSIGVTLDAGQVVTTGTCLVPLPVTAGDQVRMDFGVLGTVDVRLR